MTLYLQVNSIKGNVTEKGHENWIALKNLQFHLKRSHDMTTGCASNRTGSKPNFSEIEISKDMDSASAVLFQQACLGSSFKQLEIHACHTGDSFTPYVKYIFQNAICTYYSPCLGEKAREIFRFGFTKAQMTYVGRDGKNNPQAPQTAGYDLEKAATL